MNQHASDSERFGARGGTRTPTPLLASGPKPGASTNFATRAGHPKAKGGLREQTARSKSVKGKF